MRLCWNSTYGPMAVNARYYVWRVIHVPSGEDLERVIFADDETGEIWRFLRDERTHYKLEGGHPVVEKLQLGAGQIRLELK